MDKKPYKVTSPIEHDHKRYEIGSEIALEPDQAQALKKARAIEDIIPQMPPADEPVAKSSPVETEKGKKGRR